MHTTPKLTAVMALTMGVLLASPATAHADKYGYVDIQRALREVEDGRKAMDDLQKEFNSKQVELDQRKTNLEKLKQELETQGDMMKPDLRQAKEKEFQERFLEWQKLGMELQKDLDRSHMAKTKHVLDRMQEILEQIGKEQDFDMILLKETVLYAPSHFDLTNELIRKYNDRWGQKTKDKDAKKKDKKG